MPPASPEPEPRTPAAAPRGAAETRERLLDAAEELFAERGFRGASVRDITGAAGANLASANYHFGSKEGLLRAVLERRLSAINGERLARLAALEARAEPVRLEELVQAYVGPPLEAASDPEARSFVRVMARLHADADGPFQRALDPAWFAPLLERFGRALARCLPELDPLTLAWRMQLMTGAMAHVILRGSTLSRMPVCTTRELDLADTLPQLTSFLTGALRGAPAAPATSEPDASRDPDLQ